MRYVNCREPGDVHVLEVVEGRRPEPANGQLLVRVHACALNRGDTLQRSGHYVPPPDQNQILGVEVAGEVVALGPGTEGPVVGDRVMGLVAGGGYADFCIMESWAAVVIPSSLSYLEAAALPEACYTAGETLLHLGALKAGQSVLVHAGASGIGTMVLQMARHLGARSFFTVGSESKREQCLALGGDLGILYKKEDFATRVLDETDGRGVDLIVDFIGADYLERNINALAADGLLILAGVLGGWQGSVDLLPVILKRQSIKGFSIRGQSAEDKARIVSRFRDHWLAPIRQGHIRPVVHGSWPLEQVAEAHREMEANLNVGKILLTCRSH